MSIHIVTDSTSYLPGGYAEQHGIDIVPLRITIDGVLYREFVDIASDEFYMKQESGAKAVTSQPGRRSLSGSTRGCWRTRRMRFSVFISPAL